MMFLGLGVEVNVNVNTNINWYIDSSIYSCLVLFILWSILKIVQIEVYCISSARTFASGICICEA